MPKRKSMRTKKNPRQTRHNDIEVTEADNHVDITVIPEDDYSGESDCSIESGNDSDGEDSDADEEIDLNFSKSFRQVVNLYTDSQKKLEENHNYNWVEGEINYENNLENETHLKNKDIDKIKNSTFTEIFEFFFSSEVKNHIIECTALHGYEISLQDLDIFVGIIIFSCFNKRLSQRDYWSTDTFLGAENVASSMGVKKFEKIKSMMKLHKPSDEDKEDKIWRVRQFTNIFKKNISQFGYFSSALSIDEMMIKYFGRCSLKQFISSKPIRFGIKMWGLASADGYLFNFEIYCEKNANYRLLPKCSLGSRVVMQMLEDLLKLTSPRNMNSYHVYFDNLFCSADLLVHLKKLGLRCTGTIRQDRVPSKHKIDKKDDRGTCHAMYDKNSGVNYITIMDSKPVSMLSTAAGVQPTAYVERYNRNEKLQKQISFPKAFCAYNKHMGGIDIHDQRCNKLLPVFRSKKWTWVIFLRCIQMSITNATVLANIADKKKGKKVGTKEVAMAIARSYLNKKKLNPKLHVVEQTSNQRYCSNVESCSLRTRKFCKTCQLYFCKNCFESTHSLK